MRFLFGWKAWELTHSALWVGVLAGAMLLPTIAFSPFFGIVSDRINPRNGLLVTIFMYGLVASITGIAGTLNLLSLPLLTALSIALGVVMSAHTPIRLALVPRLVKRQALPSAIGYNSVIFNISRVAGPAIGAWLITVVSVPYAFFLVTGLCIASIAVIASIKGIAKKDREKSLGFFSELRAGFAYAAQHPVIRLIFAFVLLNGFLGRTLLELLPALSGQLLNGTADTLATLSAAAGAGAIAGGLLVSRQGGSDKVLFRLVAINLVLSSLCLLSIQWLSGPREFTALVFILSLATSVSGIGSQALTQLTVEEAYRGRIISLWAMLAVGSPAIGAVAVGAMAQTWGFAVICAAIALVTLALLGILRLILRK